MLIRFMIGIFLSMLLGCTTIAKKYEINPIMNEQTDLLKDDSDDFVDPAKLKARVTAATTAELRNDLVNELITISDRTCSIHQAEIVSNTNTWNVATGTATNLLSALGTVLGGASTKTALAAGAAFSSGSRSLINEEIYLKSLGTTVARAISIAREKNYSEIALAMKKPLIEYTVSAGLRDVQEYHRKCSFYYGMIEISKSLDQRKKTKIELSFDISELVRYRADLVSQGENTDEVDKKIEKLVFEKVDAPN